MITMRLLALLALFALPAFAQESLPDAAPDSELLSPAAPEEDYFARDTYRIDTVVCGGISLEERELLNTCVPSVIENVACSAEDALAALEGGTLRPGFGFARVDSAARRRRRHGEDGTQTATQASSPGSQPFPSSNGTAPGLDPGCWDSGRISSSESCGSRRGD